MGIVIAFPVKPDANRLTQSDRAALFAWDAVCDNPNFERVAFHEALTLNDETCADVALIYPPGSEWAGWGLARACGQILVWDCASHRDIGRFDSVTEALAALEARAGRCLVRRSRNAPRHSAPARTTATV